MLGRILFLAILMNAAFAANALDLNLIKKASFEETFERYPSPFAILQQFKRIIPVDGNAGAHPECTNMNEMSAPVSGVNDPMQLGPLEQTPGELFYQYYVDCVHKIVSGGFYLPAYSQQNAKAILTLEDRIQLAKGDAALAESEAFAHALFTATAWKDLDPKDQIRLMNAFLLNLVGPESILRAKGYFGENNAFQTQLPTHSALVDFLNEFALSLTGSAFGATNPGVADVYREIAIIVRLGPALKN